MAFNNNKHHNNNNKGGFRRPNGQQQQKRKSYLEQQIEKNGEDFMYREAFKIKLEASKILRDLVKGNMNITMLHEYLTKNPMVLNGMIEHINEVWQEDYTIWSALDLNMKYNTSVNLEVSVQLSATHTKYNGKCMCYNVIMQNLKGYQQTSDIGYLATISADPKKLNKFY